MNSDLNKNIYKLYILFISLLPVFLITGPFLPDFVISFVALYVIIYSLKKNNNLNIKKIIIENKIIKFLLLFWIYITICSLWSENIFYSLKSSFFYFRFIFFSIFLYFLFTHYSNFIKYFFYASSFALIFLIFDSFVQYFFDYDIFLNPKPKNRLTATFGDEQVVGSFIAKFTPFYIGLAVLFKKNIKNYLIMTLIILCCLITFLSGERTATFYVITSSLVIMSLLFINQKKIILYFVLIMVLIISTVVIFDKNIKKRHSSAIDTIFNTKNNKLTLFSEAHEYHYLSAYKIFLDNKIIGVGPKMYRFKCKDDKYYENHMSCTTHPHNVLLQILSETGIIGFLFYLTAIYYCISSFFKNYINYFKNKNKIIFFKICLLMSILQYLSFLLPSGNIFNNWLLANLFIPLSFFIYFNFQEKK